MNVVFISILTFSDLDIALSTRQTCSLSGLWIVAWIKLHIRHCFSSFLYSCLSLFSHCNEQHPRVKRSVCTYVLKTDRHAETVLFILGHACTQVHVPVTSFSFWLSLWCLRAVNQESMEDHIRNIDHNSASDHWNVKGFWHYILFCAILYIVSMIE